jgi:hypothetical protein
MYMILFVLHDPNRLHDVLTTWNAAGVSGITIPQHWAEAHARIHRFT